MQVSFNPSVNFKGNSIREGVSKTAKFFTNISEMTKASAKAVGYGTMTAGATFAGFWIFGAVPRTVKNGSLEAFKSPIKSLSTRGKIITIAAGVLVAGIELIKGKLRANQKTANVDHQLKTGHRTV